MAQILIYVGGILALILFGVMLTPPDLGERKLSARADRPGPGAGRNVGWVIAEGRRDRASGRPPVRPATGRSTRRPRARSRAPSGSASASWPPTSTSSPSSWRPSSSPWRWSRRSTSPAAARRTSSPPSRRAPAPKEEPDGPRSLRRSLGRCSSPWASSRSSRVATCIYILMGIEMILNAANINFVAFNRFGYHLTDGGRPVTAGQMFADLHDHPGGRRSGGRPGHRPERVPPVRLGQAERGRPPARVVATSPLHSRPRPQRTRWPPSCPRSPRVRSSSPTGGCSSRCR